MIPARLACVKHAASVRPEPGSNSDVQSFTLLLISAFHSPKLPASYQESSVYSLRNLTVLVFLIYSLLYRFQGSSLSFRAVCVAVLATTLMIIANPYVLVNPFFQLFFSLTYFTVFDHFPAYFRLKRAGFGGFRGQMTRFPGFYRKSPPRNSVCSTDHPDEAEQ